MHIEKKILIILLIILSAASCSRREPVTVLFTSDVQGRLVPSG